MRIEYQLQPKELEEIEKAIGQDKRAEVRHRATVIRLLHLGYKPQEAAKQQMVSVPTIYNWHKLWRTEGIEGLANKPRKGRKPKADENYCQKLEAILAKEPSDYGYRFAIWTSDRLRFHLEKETGILLSESRFRALLKIKRLSLPASQISAEPLTRPGSQTTDRKGIGSVEKRVSQTISSSSLWTK